MDLHEPVPNAYYEITPTGLITHKAALTWTEWDAMFHTIWRIYTSIRWAIGDALLLAEAFDPDTSVIQQAIDITQYSVQTLYNLKKTSRRFPRHRRRADLSHSHHQACDGWYIPDAVQDRWLTLAVQKGWGRDDIRRLARAYKDKLDAPDNKIIPVTQDMPPADMDVAALSNPHGITFSAHVVRRSSGTMVLETDDPIPDNWLGKRLTVTVALHE